MSAGYFEYWANSIAYTPTSADRALAKLVEEQAREVLGTANLQWAGSNAKHIAIKGSDLDLFVMTPTEVTQDQRRKLAAALRAKTGREVNILSHAIRISGTPRVDINFEKSNFGHRPGPEVDEFAGCPARQQAARALKFWCNRSGMPSMKGWVAEAVVLHLDPNRNRSGFEIFLRILEWFDENSNEEVGQKAMEAILRPVCQTAWKEVWSAKLPGYTQALGNDARRIRKRLLKESIQSAAQLEGVILNAAP